MAFVSVRIRAGRLADGPVAFAAGAAPAGAPACPDGPLVFPVIVSAFFPFTSPTCPDGPLVLPVIVSCWELAAPVGFALPPCEPSPIARNVGIMSWTSRSAFCFWFRQTTMIEELSSWLAWGFGIIGLVLPRPWLVRRC